MRPGRVQVFAVIRLDRYFTDPEEQIAVQSVVPTADEARAEVERLNGLVDSDQTRYFWRATRFYPQGRDCSSDSSPLP